MKKRILLILSLFLIVLTSIGSFVFAKEIIDDSSPAPNVLEKTGYGFACRLECQNEPLMIEIMKKTGYDNMAKWMEDGNTEEIKKYINNLTVGEYDEMMQTIHKHKSEYFQDQARPYGKSTNLYNHHGMGMMRGGASRHRGMGGMSRMFNNR